jgi:hypothetical protein
LRFALCDPHQGLVEHPAHMAGALIDFDPDGGPQPGWLRVGGRIAVRESADP